jgi:hypothetical protein
MLSASEAYDSETVSDLAEEIGEFAVDADWHLALHTIERIRSTDAKTLRDCARKFLVPERRVVGWSLPRASASTATSERPKSGKARSAARSRSTTPSRSEPQKRAGKPVRSGRSNRTAKAIRSVAGKKRA